MKTYMKKNSKTFGDIGKMEFEKIERQKNSNQDTDQVSISKRKNVT